jgi:branched-chain amino acid transport system permease protein
VGVNITARKVQVFAISAAIGALAGGVNAPLQTAIDPSLFSTAVSLQLFVMVILGGLGNIYGAVLGAALVTWLISAVPAGGSWALTVLGVIVIAFMALLPDGLAGLGRVARALSRRLARRGPRAVITEVPE